jgi:hypothetical protein
LAIGSFAFALGCVPVVYRDPVTVVPTRTPGVAYVIVHPNMDQQPATSPTQPGDGSRVQGNSDYVLLCDARPPDGMRCSVVVEAAFDRYSYTPANGVAAAPVREGVGTLGWEGRDKNESDTGSQSSGDKQPAEGGAK